MAQFRMVTPGGKDPCFSRGFMPAKVERTAELTTITVSPTVSGCEEFRYTVKNDGSGGVKHTLRSEKWVRSPFDHGLTPVK